MMPRPLENPKQKISVLARRQDFLRIAGTRKKWVSNSMIIQVAKAPDQDGTGIRVGYTASKKVGNAVMRNRARRRLREVVRQLLWDKGEAGHDYVVIARAAISGMSFDHLIRDFSWCLKRLNSNKDSNRGGKTPERGPIK